MMSPHLNHNSVSTEESTRTLKLDLAVLIALSLLACSVQAENWALLIAGSNEYYNYRHQADICHAYQILHRNGIPDERIVVMMYDDIAFNDENPNQGEIINRPNGPNVYTGVPKDYTKEEVTPGNFLKVLQGQSVNVGSKKVINSGPNDNVFVYFADHGAPGIVAFPNGDVLTSSQLNKAIKNMHANKRYKNLVLYIEACESGSMFQKLLAENINVYATTAANAEESSYACYYDDKRDTYLGDLYSVNWMEDSDRQDITKETLYTQFNIVKKLTNESHVMQFGNLTMGQSFTVSQFQSENDESAFKPQLGLYRRIDPNADAIKTEDVRMSIIRNKLAKETNPVKIEALMLELRTVQRLMKLAAGTMRSIATRIMGESNTNALRNIFSTKASLNDFECYESAVSYLFDKCFNAKNEYVLRNLYILVNLCENSVKAETIHSAIDTVCPTRLD